MTDEKINIYQKLKEQKKLNFTLKEFYYERSIHLY